MSAWFVALLTLSQPDASAKLVVDFSAERPEEEWVADAFEQNASRDLAGHRGQLVDKNQIDIRGCERRDARCLVQKYAAAGIDLILIGRLDGDTLEIQVFEGWLKTRISKTKLDLSQRPTLIAVRNQTLATVVPFFESGGLLEKKQWILGGPAAKDSDLSWTLVVGSLLASLAFLFIPIAIGRSIGVRSKRTLRWSLRFSTVMPFALLASSIARGLEGLDWLLPMAGGAAWSWFVLLTLQMAVPEIVGLSNIRHGNVSRMLRAWCVVAALRFLLLILCFGPPMVALAFGTAALGVSERTAWTMLVPLFGLLLHFWIRSLVEHLALRLDRSLVVGKAGPENPWHPVVKKYFLGYVKRAGLEIDRGVLERTLFLPGTRNEILSYGGALSSARIAVPEALLETALHPLADEPLIQEEDARALDQGDPTGLLLPGGAEKRRLREREHVPARRRLQHPLLGQNETMLGYVLPIPKGESIPLVIDDPDEYSVLRDLLTAHYRAFDPKLYGEEADDTDPTQKDFLFGALLREVGCVQRKDTLLDTPLLWIDLLLARGPKVLRALERIVIDTYRRFVARYPAIIADGYAALNRGLHHLIQHLDHRRTGSDEGLTARADEPALASASSEILRRIAAETGSPGDPTRNRLVWLSQHLLTPIPEPRGLALRVLLTLAIVLGSAGALGAWVIESIEYQPVYERRIAELKQKIEQAREKGASNGQ